MKICFQNPKNTLSGRGIAVYRKKSSFILFLLLSFCMQHAAAQTIEFTYDAGGNRTMLKLNSVQPDKPTITQSGDELVSSAATGNQWFFENDSIPGATGQRYKPTQGGNYKVRVRNNDCVSEFSALKNVVITAIINVPNGQFIRFGPNPVSSQLNVYFSLNNTSKITVTVVDINGKEVLRKAVSSGQSLNMSGLSNGVYVLKVIGSKNENHGTVRIVKLY